MVVLDNVPVPLLIGLRGSSAGLLATPSKLPPKVHRPGRFDPTAHVAKQQQLKAAAQLAAQQQQRHTSPRMARSRSSPSHRRAHRPSTAPAPAAAAPSTAAEEDVFDEEEEPQGEMAGMSVGDFVEEVKMAEAKLLDEQAAEREAAYRAKQLEEWYGRVGHLIRSLDETPPELQDAHAPPPDMLELPRDGPGARVLRLLKDADERRQMAMDGLFAQLDKGRREGDEVSQALAASLAATREQLAELEKGQNEIVFELAHLLDDRDGAASAELAQSERGEQLGRAQGRLQQLAAKAEAHRQALLSKQEELEALADKEAKRYQPVFDVDEEAEKKKRAQKLEQEMANLRKVGRARGSGGGGERPKRP